jgi:hypothetical protein
MSSAVVSGTVTRGGVPVPGVYVRLLDRSGEYTGEHRTGDDGAFLFNTSGGDWTLVILGRGLERRAHAVSVAPGEHTTVNLELD